MPEAPASPSHDAPRPYDVLDTPPEDAFDRIGELAAHLFDAPMALVSLIDAEQGRQWFKACIGLETRETSLDVSFCIHAVRAEQTLVVEDATEDSRFADTPLVTGEPGIRFYAGAPLVTPAGDVIGTVCVADTKPRTGAAAPTSAQIRQLEHLASMGVSELELRREAEQRRREADRRRQSEARVRGIAHSVPGVIYNFYQTEDGTYTSDFIGEQARKLLGIDAAPADTFFERFAERVAPSHREAFVRSVQAAVDDERRWEHVAPFDRPDGTRLWIQGRSVPERRDGRVVFTGVLLDVTAEKTHERALHAVNEEYETVLQGAQDAIFAIGVDRPEDELENGAPQFTLQWINASHAAQTGLDPDDVQGTSPREVLGEEQGAAVEARYRQCVEAGAPITYEETLALPGGTKTWLTKLSPVIRDGAVRQLVGVARDITARKEAERALRRERNVLQRIFDASPAPIVLLDAEGTITFASAQAEKVLGLEPTAHGRTYNDPAWEIEAPGGGPFPSDQLPFALVKRTGAPVHDVEHAIRWPDGTRRLLSVSGAPLNRDEESFEGAVFIMQDITEKRHLERQLRQAQKMESVGTLAGGLAHDLNNILHAARTHLDFSQTDLAAEHPVQDSLRHIDRGLERAGGLVRKLLAFSRPQPAGTVEEVDVGALTTEALDLATPSLPKAVTVRTELGDDCRVEADPDQIQQVALNLITNAGQALERPAPQRSGRLDICVRRVEVGPDLAGAHLRLRPGPHVQLSVSDTGTGMDAATQARIFDPFYTTKERGQQKGTGLGLAIVRGIVDALGGEITVQSEPGAGTTFDVYLPAASCEDVPCDLSSGSASSGRTASRSAPASEQPRVLVVDDDPNVRELEAGRLPRLGVRAETHGDARRALGALEKALATDVPCSAVLTDYNMPGMNGLELARRVRRMGFAGPVVMMTGFRAQVSEAEARAAGVDRLLQKPVSSEELQRAMRDLV